MDERILDSVVVEERHSTLEVVEMCSCCVFFRVDFRRIMDSIGRFQMRENFRAEVPSSDMSIKPPAFCQAGSCGTFRTA